MNASRFAAIVLAGERGPDEPVAQAMHAPCKALAPVAGRPLIEHGLGVIAGMGFRRVTVVGPSAALLETHERLAALLRRTGAQWLAPADSPSASAAQALAGLAADEPALITTADHALLTPAMIAPMLDATDTDLSVALTPYAGVRAAYPESRRSAIRLRPGTGFCGCNLFAVHTPRGRALVEHWRAVERQRKHPVRMIAGLLGWPAVARYATRTLTLDAAFARLSARTGLTVRPHLLDIPEAAIDVDSVADLHLVQRVLAARR